MAAKHPVVTRITKESISKLLDKIYLACLKADKDRVRDHMLEAALDVIYKEIKHGHDGCNANPVFLERVASLLPAIITAKDDFNFIFDLPELVDEIANSVNPKHEIRATPYH